MRNPFTRIVHPLAARPSPSHKARRFLSPCQWGFNFIGGISFVLGIQHHRIREVDFVNTRNDIVRIVFLRITFWKLVQGSNFQESKAQVRNTREGSKSPSLTDGNISCQNPLGLSSRERGRYDLQTIISGGVKNEGNIARLSKKSPSRFLGEMKKK